MTTSTRRVALTLLCSAVSASLLGAQVRPHYRAYQMGDDVLTISRQLGMPAPASTLISSPALGALEELRWRSQYIRRGVASSSDPVAQLVFSFFENKLFRIVIYASDRTEGMTEADVVAATGHQQSAHTLQALWDCTHSGPRTVWSRNGQTPGTG
jgi:hypothetical protein